MLNCGCKPGELDYSTESEHGDLIEIEVANSRYIINIMGRIGLNGIGQSEMFITDDLEKLTAIRNALTNIIDHEKG